MIVLYFVKTFKCGMYQFLPMIQIWTYLYQSIIYLRSQIIRPKFKHIISPFLCLRLHGSAIIQEATSRIRQALLLGQYHYVLRLDIRHCYTSINHCILLNQLNQHFDDFKLLNYFEAIVKPSAYFHSDVFLPRQSMPKRSSALLSLFCKVGGLVELFSRINANLIDSEMGRGCWTRIADCLGRTSIATLADFGEIN